MAKKITVADMKAGLIYRCANCDAKCDGSLSHLEYYTKDICLGRVDHRKKTFTYFCSISCSRYNYIQYMTPVIQGQFEMYSLVVKDAIPKYRKMIDEGAGDTKEFLEFIILIKSIARFLKAWLAHKSEYELHELRLKSQKHCGDFMEEHHDNSVFVEFALKSHKKIQDMDISTFG